MKWYIYMCIYIYIYLYIFNYIYISIYIFTFAPGTCTNALMGEGPWISIITRIQTPGAPEFVQSERKACCWRSPKVRCFWCQGTPASSIIFPPGLLHHWSEKWVVLENHELLGYGLKWCHQNSWSFQFLTWNQWSRRCLWISLAFGQV